MVSMAIASRAIVNRAMVGMSTVVLPHQVAINAWLGPRGTASPLHYDRVHNLLAQAPRHLALYLL